MNGQDAPKKRDNRLAKEQAMVADVMSGTRHLLTLSMDQLLVFGAHYPSHQYPASDFLAVFRKEHVSWVMHEFPHLLVRRIVNEEKDVPEWCEAFFDYHQRHRQALSPKTMERGLFRTGHMLGYRASFSFLQQTLAQLKDTLPPLFVSGMVWGAFGERTGQNIGLLLKAGMVDERMVGRYLEKCVYVPENHNKQKMSTFSFSPVHKQVLQTLYHLGDTRVKDVLLLGAGHIACRAQNREARTVARKFFAKYYSVPHAQEVIAQLDVGKDVKLRWGENLLPHQAPFVPLVCDFFAILFKTPSPCLLQQMLLWKQRNAQGWDDTLEKRFGGVGLETTLKEYEKCVLLSQVPQKQPTPFARKM